MPHPNSNNINNPTSRKANQVPAVMATYGGQSSADWNKDQLKRFAALRRERQKAAAAEAEPVLAPILSYSPLQRLQNIARAQYIRPDSVTLPDDIREELTEEWLGMVDVAFKKLRERVTCEKCESVHAERDGKLDEEWDVLREEMEGREGEEVCEEMVERWERIFKRIKGISWEARGRSRCGVRGGGIERDMGIRYDFPQRGDCGDEGEGGRNGEGQTEKEVTWKDFVD